MAIINPLNSCKLKRPSRKKRDLQSESVLHKSMGEDWEAAGESSGVGNSCGRHVLVGKEGGAAAEQLRCDPGRK